MSSSPPPTADTPDGEPRRAGSASDPARDRRRRKLRRRASATLLLLGALVGTGFVASSLSPTPQVATASEDQAALVREGKQLYDTSCITCHGANLTGIPDRGPSLIGVGDAAVYFQVSSGRMPAAAQGAQMPRKQPKFDAHQTDALGAFIQAHGGGPTVVRDADGEIAQGSLRGGDVARGSELFRLNCASCHNFTGRGGTLSSGKYAPTLDPANEQQIYTAMLTGPENMPKFSDRQLTPDEKKDIIAYVKSSSETPSQGGYGLGGLGPAAEAGAIWIVGILALVGATLWIGARS